MAGRPSPTRQVPHAGRRSRVTARTCAVTLLLTVSPPLPGAQRVADEAVATAVDNAHVRAALEHIESRRADTVTFLADIAAIVSPSGQERDRAEAVARRMRAVGLESVIIDDTPNAVGVIPGRSGRALVFVSTLDDLATVAAHQEATADLRTSTATGSSALAPTLHRRQPRSSRRPRRWSQLASSRSTISCLPQLPRKRPAWSE